MLNYCDNFSFQRYSKVETESERMSVQHKITDYNMQIVIEDYEYEQLRRINNKKLTIQNVQNVQNFNLSDQQINVN